jgi:hypothetical protein
MPRTEEAILSGEFSFTLNKKPYTVTERSIRLTREWIRKVVEQDGSVATKFFAAKESDEQVSILSGSGFDQVAGLITEYSNGQIKPEDLEDATVTELRTALDQILEIAGFFDLVWGKTRRMQGKTT